MRQKDGEKWAAAVDLQPTIPKSDKLLDLTEFVNAQRRTSSTSVLNSSISSKLR